MEFNEIGVHIGVATAQFIYLPLLKDAVVLALSRNRELATLTEAIYTAGDYIYPIIIITTKLILKE